MVEPHTKVRKLWVSTMLQEHRETRLKFCPQNQSRQESKSDDQCDPIQVLYSHFLLFYVTFVHCFYTSLELDLCNNNQGPWGVCCYPRTACCKHKSELCWEGRPGKCIENTSIWSFNCAELPWHYGRKMYLLLSSHLRGFWRNMTDWIKPTVPVNQQC